ncbi:hypothetical protein MMSP_0832 [Mycobacterium sp. 012931]|nr:hypothetical protein MMSP_0832 [Mycobacterium sp. 012931]
MTASLTLKPHRWHLPGDHESKMARQQGSTARSSRNAAMG